MNEIFRESIKSGKLNEKWDSPQIDELEVNGYALQGRFGSDQPLEPLDPFEPLNPWKRRPIPQRPFRIPESPVKENHEPFVDISEEEKGGKNIYYLADGCLPLGIRSGSGEE